MFIVAGHLIVDPEARPEYLAGCVPVVEQARLAQGCLDFSLSADLIDPARINILERWESHQALDAFRGDGPSRGQQSAIRLADVAEYEIAGTLRLS
jgi:quinol monooxygenase YgiN